MKTPVRFRAFTLIELLIVVSILAILSAFLIPGFSNYLDTQNIKQAQEQVKSDLRTAQNRALNGVGSAPTVNYWGIRNGGANSSRYYFFTSGQADLTTCNAVGTGLETSMKLPGGAVIKNDAFCVFFSFDNGDAVFVGNGISGSEFQITLGYSDSTGNECFKVILNSGGLIYGQTAKSLCT